MGFVDDTTQSTLRLVTAHPTDGPRVGLYRRCCSGDGTPTISWSDFVDSYSPGFCSACAPSIHDPRRTLSTALGLTARWRIPLQQLISGLCERSWARRCISRAGDWRRLLGNRPQDNGLSVLVLASKQIKQWGFSKCALMYCIHFLWFNALHRSPKKGYWGKAR